MSLLMSPPPSMSYQPLPFTPHHSSPLATTSHELSSPIMSVQARRRGSYKPMGARRPPARRKTLMMMPNSDPDDPTRTWMKDKFREKCMQRMMQERGRAIAKRREGGNIFAAGESDAMDEGDDEDGLDDELFRRIMANEMRKRNHAYNVSYEQEVGGSFDPEMEDPSALEERLQNEMNSRAQEEVYDPDEELEAYAEEYELEQYFGPDELSSEIDEADLVDLLPDSDMDLGIPPGNSGYRPAPREDGFTTPQKLQALAKELFPSST